MWTWSIAAFAALAAEDAPRASMIAAPRLATVGMKSFSSQSWSSTTSAAVWPPISAWKMSGYCVAEWLPQIVSRVMSSTRRSSCASQLAQRAVVVEARHRGEPLGRHVRRVGRGDQRVGVGRVADDEDAYVVGGAGVDRLALRLEDAAVRLEQVAALHARRTRPGADEQRDVRPRRRRRVASSVMSMPASSGNAQSSSSIAVPSAALQRRRDLEQPEPDGHVRAEQLTGGDAEQQGVADLAGRAGDGDVDGSGGEGAHHAPQG